MTDDPLAVLATAVESLLPYLQESGELHDPVFEQPTQYGTAYFALCNAVLATLGPPKRRSFHRDCALRGLDAALTHTADPSLPPTASGFDRVTGAVSRINHRDFTWPPILKTYRLVAKDDAAVGRQFASRIRDVDIEASFRSRPPSNWAAVWLSGEWIRIREGLSPKTVDDVDAWLDVFLEDLLRPDDGFYFEPGKPNSYDLFTRFHMADLLAEGYDGRHRDALERLLSTGLERSLAVQLSDGSLASAHRSTGQTWTLGAQVAFFTHASNLLADHDGELAGRSKQAVGAAWRAFLSLRRWQRERGPFSPVENVLPPPYRVGYEGYTADAHYSSLALGFLSVALSAGFDARAEDGFQAERPPSVRAEHDPIFRAVAHAGRYSVAVNADPAPQYDGFGITDLTVGPNRVLQFASSVRHLQAGTFFNLGMARRTAPGRTELDVMAQRKLTLESPLEGSVSRRAEVRLRAVSTDGEALAYWMDVTVDRDGVTVEESTPGTADYRTLLVPYVRDPGTGTETRVERLPHGIRLVHGEEKVVITADQTIESLTDLPYGYENRRGLCGLVRLDFAETTDRIRYRVTTG